MRPELKDGLAYTGRAEVLWRTNTAEWCAGGVGAKLLVFSTLILKVAKYRSSHSGLLIPGERSR
jgi:hypothetical protein